LFYLTSNTKKKKKNNRRKTIPYIPTIDIKPEFVMKDILDSQRKLNTLTKQLSSQLKPINTIKISRNLASLKPINTIKISKNLSRNLKPIKIEPPVFPRPQADKLSELLKTQREILKQMKNVHAKLDDSQKNLMK